MPMRTESRSGFKARQSFSQRAVAGDAAVQKGQVPVGVGGVQEVRDQIGVAAAQAVVGDFGAGAACVGDAVALKEDGAVFLEKHR